MDYTIIDIRGERLTKKYLRGVLPRISEDATYSRDAVREIVTKVKNQGFAAVREYTRKFDEVTIRSFKDLRVPRSTIAAAADALDRTIRQALEESIRRARIFASAQKPSDVNVEIAPGARLQLRWEAIARVGVYIPGGLAVYPSSVIMNIVPAQAAGVESLALVSPPQRHCGGLPHPSILAAAHLLGIEEVYAVGGAQAIAALAYGLEDGADVLEPVDFIAGPGNFFVAAAKALVRSQVGIDAEAGPTEILILADDSANPIFVAADLISQAEHDVLASAVLVTDSEALARAVSAELKLQVPASKHSERIDASLSGKQSGLILVDDMAAAVAVANVYAAEHLEVMARDSKSIAARIRNAGAVFIGDSAPVSLGDYSAGSNHVLPTGGSAVYTSGLGTASFMKAIQVIDYSRQALLEVASGIVALAGEEDLPAHGRAVTVRGGH